MNTSDKEVSKRSLLTKSVHWLLKENRF